MRQATFYAGIQARTACMLLTLLYKHKTHASRDDLRWYTSTNRMHAFDTAIQARITQFGTAYSSACGTIRGAHGRASARAALSAVAAASRRRLRCFRLLHWYAAWTVAFAIGSHDATLGRPVGHLTRPVLYKRATCVSIDKLRTGVVTKLFLRGISASAS